MTEFVDHQIQMERKPNSYFYLLVDPLKPVSYINPLHINNLQHSLGHDAVVTVRRTDLTHSLQHCPLLIRLASPGNNINQEVLEASIKNAQSERGQEKRYVCGWLSDLQPIDVVAYTLAERAYLAGQMMGDRSVLPFFEPLRFELLQAVKGFNEFIWPVQQWWSVSASGEMLYLESKIREKEWQPDWGTLRNQMELREIWGVLFAWQRVCAALPGSAALKAAEAWAKTAKYQLPHSQDRQYLALNELTLPVDMTKHPSIQSLIKQAKSDPLLRLTQLMASAPDATWQELNGSTGCKHDS